jgi:hypothetical protein
VRPVPCTLTAASSLLITGSGYIVYWSALDGSGGGSVFQLVDGQNAGGQLLMAVATTAGESTSEYIGKRLLFYTKSLYFDLVSGGPIAGSVTVHACDSAEELQRLMATLSTLQDIAQGVAG